MQLLIHNFLKNDSISFQSLNKKTNRLFLNLFSQFGCIQK